MSQEHPVSLRAQDPAALIRSVLERRHLSPSLSLVVGRGGGEKRTVRFHELVEVAVMDPMLLRQALLDVLGAMHAAELELYIWVQGDRRRLRLLFGVAQRDGGDRPHVDALLRRSLEGNLPGSKFEAIVANDVEQAPTGSLELSEACGVILGIPGKREDEADVRTLDGALESLAGMDFDLIVRCAPLGPEALDIAEANLALVSGQAHLLAKHTTAKTDSNSFSNAISNGFSLAHSSTLTTNWSTATTRGTSLVVQGPGEEALGTTAGSILGAVIGGVGGFFAGGPLGAAYGAQIGAAGGAQIGGAVARLNCPQMTTSDSESSQRGGGFSCGESETRTSTSTDTTGRQFARQISLEVVNRQAGLLEAVAERHLERIRAGRSLGMWRTSVHLATRSHADLQVAGHLLIGALRGDNTHLEPLRLLSYADNSARTAIEGLRALQPPVLSGPAHPLIPGAEQLETLLTSDELGAWLPVPCHDLPGISAREVVHFGRGGTAVLRHRDTESIALGPLVFGGRTSPSATVSLLLRDLTSHVFVAGTTGAGKTTTIKHILRGLQELKQPVPFLLLEPAKSEYADLFEELQRSGKRPLRLELGAAATSDTVRPLRFNPFVAPTGLPLGRHVEALKVLLRSCFEMQESLPQLLEALIFDTYKDLGWTDMSAPVSASHASSRTFPSFAEFLRKVPTRTTVPESRIQRVVREFGYEERVERNLVAALTVRLQAFSRGLKEAVFGADDIDVASILQRPCFINVSDINEPDIRRFLLASLFLRLYSEREAARRRGEGCGPGLRHLIVLEEAHHFLREAHVDAPGAELVRQSNIILSDAFAELRAYGQAILVADQAPGELAQAVVRNTNTKIIHRLFQQNDVSTMAEAIGLDEGRCGELRRLRPGECVVFSPSLQVPVACQIVAE